MVGKSAREVTSSIRVRRRGLRQRPGSSQGGRGGGHRGGRRRGAAGGAGRDGAAADRARGSQMSPLLSSPDEDGGPAPAGPTPASTPFESWDLPRTPWLLPGRCRNPRRRTLMVEVTSRALFPTILVFSVYLL